MPPSANTAGGRRVTRWTRETIIEKITEWNELYGEPPCSADWNPSLARWRAQEWRAERYRDGIWPSTNAAKRPFDGSFDAAVRAAGLEPHRSGPRRRPAGTARPTLSSARRQAPRQRQRRAGGGRRARAGSGAPRGRAGADRPGGRAPCDARGGPARRRAHARPPCRRPRASCPPGPRPRASRAQSVEHRGARRGRGCPRARGLRPGGGRRRGHPRGPPRPPSGGPRGRRRGACHGGGAPARSGHRGDRRHHDIRPRATGGTRRTATGTLRSRHHADGDAAWRRRGRGGFAAAVAQAQAESGGAIAAAMAAARAAEDRAAVAERRARELATLVCGEPRQLTRAEMAAPA